MIWLFSLISWNRGLRRVSRSTAPTLRELIGVVRCTSMPRPRARFLAASKVFAEGSGISQSAWSRIRRRLALPYESAGRRRAGQFHAWQKDVEPCRRPGADHRHDPITLVPGAHARGGARD
jgi:hypothetical protein